MASYVKYDNFVQVLANKEVDVFGNPPSDTWKVAIHSDTPATTTDTSLSDLTQIAGNNGYTTGGADTQMVGTRTGATFSAVATDYTWTATTNNLGSSTTGRYFSLYDDTPTTPTADPLAGYWDYGAAFTVAVGETMTIDFGSSAFTLA